MASFWFLSLQISFSRQSRISSTTLGLQHSGCLVLCLPPDATSSADGQLSLQLNPDGPERASSSVSCKLLVSREGRSMSAHSRRRCEAQHNRHAQESTPHMCSVSPPRAAIAPQPVQPSRFDAVVMAPTRKRCTLNASSSMATIIDIPSGNYTRPELPEGCAQGARHNSQ